MWLTKLRKFTKMMVLRSSLFFGQGTMDPLFTKDNPIYSYILQIDCQGLRWSTSSMGVSGQLRPHIFIRPIDSPYLSSKEQVHLRVLNNMSTTVDVGMMRAHPNVNKGQRHYIPQVCYLFALCTCASCLLPRPPGLVGSPTFRFRVVLSFGKINISLMICCWYFRFRPTHARSAFKRAIFRLLQLRQK